MMLPWLAGVSGVLEQRLSDVIGSFHVNELK
jgi:hypothetical protein